MKLCMIQNPTRLRVSLLAFTMVVVGAAPLRSAAADSQPCSSTSETRQLDYWIGDWTITVAGSPRTSASKVTQELGNCVFVEKWTGSNGHSGETILAYSAEAKNWYGMFADSEGRVHLFTNGTVKAGSAEFRGPSVGPNGGTVLNRVQLVRLSPSKVEQTWEKSTDNGANWNTVFKGEYSRVSR
jgi:hypothetical protein